MAGRRSSPVPSLRRARNTRGSERRAQRVRGERRGQTSAGRAARECPVRRVPVLAAEGRALDVRGAAARRVRGTQPSGEASKTVSAHGAWRAWSSSRGVRGTHPPSPTGLEGAAQGTEGQGSAWDLVYGAARPCLARRRRPVHVSREEGRVLAQTRDGGARRRGSDGRTVRGSAQLPA